MEATGFEEFTGGRLDEGGKYVPPTPEQEHQMNERLVRLGEVMGDAEFPWLLDGALNISLYGEDFIRYHKDLDFTVFRQDVGQLIERLAARGLGIAVSKNAPGKKVLFRLATPQDLKETWKVSLGIVAVDERGQINMQSTDSLHNADLHLHDQDQEGNIILENVGVTLPKKYITPQLKRLPSGAEVRLSHPVLVAYHKLHQERDYDKTDLLILRQYLSPEDVDFLKTTLRVEVEKRLDTGRQFLFRLWQEVSPVAAQGHEAVAQVLSHQPEILGHRQLPIVKEFTAEVKRVFVTQPGISAQEFQDQFIRFYQRATHLQGKLDFLSEW